ncbi:MAG TPA: CGNR zinc finger domain-containing protein [Thermoleophilaceae bacterium]|nr:CGNR zinc finger domain-containing protein [Thermoleophilaceae bacterium]
MDSHESTKPAPEPLALVQRFVNSLDYDDRDEELGTPDDLRDWLAERGLMGSDEQVSEGDLRRAIDVREGLRALLLTNNGEALDGHAVERLQRAASRAGVKVSFTEEGQPELVPDAVGVDGAIGRLMAIVAAAARDGSWQRLKACPRDNCMWAFYDRSKNRSGRWCKMEVCGNVEKARSYRERHKPAAA